MDYAFLTPEGGWRLTGSRVSIDSIVHAYRDGQSPESITLDFPTLSLEQVYGAIAFYLRRQTDIDDYLATQDRLFEAKREEQTQRNDPLLNRIKALRK